MPESSDKTQADYSVYQSCTDESRLAPKGERDLRQPPSASCELAGHRYVVYVVKSEATLACSACDFSEYIGAWHPK